MADRPNLLLITTDQHRWDWLGCHGTPGVETPHLDSIAARGVRFTHHVTNSSLCAPARIGLATGIAPVNLGTLSNSDALPDGIPTYYQQLRDARYRVGVVGKLDLNKPDEQNGRKGNRPDTYKWGFTDPVEVEGKMHAGRRQDDKPSGPYGWWLHEQGLFETFAADCDRRMIDVIERHLRKPEDPPLAFTRFYDDSVLPAHAFEDAYIGQRSCQWLREVPDDHPWHLYISFVGPHDPFDPPTEYAERFRDAPVPPPVLDAADGRPRGIRQKEYGNSEEQIIAARRQYSAALAVIDDQIGAILATLDELGLRDETLIVFSADHGEMLGDHRLFQKNVPYEPAIRIPLIASGPGVSAGVSDALTELVDVTATLLDVAGVAVPDGIDGRSLRPVLENPRLPHRDAVVICQEPSRTIRTRTHKFSHHVAGGQNAEELYDLDADPNETTNLIDENPTLAAKLRADLTARIGEKAMAGRNA